MSAMRWIVPVCLSLFVASCNVPPYDLTVFGPPSAPAGPKVAALLANLKCELWLDANNSAQSYYPGITTIRDLYSTTTRASLGRGHRAVIPNGGSH